MNDARSTADRRREEESTLLQLAACSRKCRPLRLSQAPPGAFPLALATGSCSCALRMLCHSCSCFKLRVWCLVRLGSLDPAAGGAECQTAGGLRLRDRHTFHIVAAPSTPPGEAKPRDARLRVAGAAQPGLGRMGMHTNGGLTRSLARPIPLDAG
jgi:hypothetical protein